jgi:cytochrome c-type biogenesis protein CcmH/NrfG
MGLITGLLTLPLAPVRGTAWLAEQIREQALNELYDEEAIQSSLMELEELHQEGVIDDEELVQAEDELLERLAAARGLAPEEGHG